MKDFKNWPVCLASLVLAVIPVFTTIVPAAFVFSLLSLPAQAAAPVTSPVGPLHLPPSDVQIPLLPTFSANPTPADFFAVHLFPVALVPVGIPSVTENRALANALSAYVQRSNLEDESILTDYLDQFPDSAWKPALLVNLGIIWRQTGYFSKAMDAWQQAWDLTKAAGGIRAKSLADRAIGELVQMNAWVGRYDALASLSAEVGDRKLTGGSSEMFASAMDGMRIMRNSPGDGFLCGPYALQQILSASQLSPFAKPLVDARSSIKGFSLAQLQQLAVEVGLKYQMAKRTTGSRFITNAVIHWKLDHYGALLREQNGRYLIRDSTFSRLYSPQIWMSKAALEDESDGYFLVPAGKLPAGWRPVNAQEGSSVWGRGSTYGRNPNALTPKDVRPCPPPATPGMPGYSMFLMLVSLNLVDVPLEYTPPVGPSVQFRITYNQRDSYSQAMPNYSNLGAQWTLDWFTYISDNGASGDRSSVTRYVSGGGAFTYAISDPSTGVYTPDRDGGALQYISASDSYVLTFPDGSQQVFSQPVTTASGVRYMYLKAQKDPQGNSLTLYYDSPMGRISYVNDSLGQSTTFHYGLASDPYKITSVSDPFGRSASFQYDENDRLQKITDEIGMVSAFTYDSGDFVTNMTTLYGITSFSYGDNGAEGARWLSVTDPSGEQEFAYSPETDLTLNVIPESETECPANPNPSVYQGFINNFLQYRNTFYFDKNVMATVGTNNFSNATIYHWLHDNDSSGSPLESELLESVKTPLENRVWYNYPGQITASYSDGITLRTPSLIARTVNDPSNSSLYLSQCAQYLYNPQGCLAQYTDPVGRQTTYSYYDNGIDLASVSQTDGSGSDLLASYGTYNSQHEPSSYTDASGQTYNIYWTSLGQLDHVVDPLSETLQCAYDNHHYLTNVVRGAISSLTTTNAMTYDSYGRLRTLNQDLEYTASYQNYMTTYSYDNLDRVTNVVFPDGTSESYVYSKLNLFAKCDRAGNRTVCTYDADGRPLTMRDRLNRLTQYSWCGCGGLASITDPNGNVTSWSRDLEGRVTAKIYNDTSSTTYAYESRSSRVQSLTDALSQVKHYSYNVDDTVAGISYSGAIHTTPSVSFTYDPVYRRLATMTDGNGETTYTYNPVASPPSLGAGRLASEYNSFTVDTIAYAYDQLGRLSNRAIDGTSESVGYDALGRMHTHDSVLGETVLGYTGPGVTSIADYNGYTETFGYGDNLHDDQLTSLNIETLAGPGSPGYGEAGTYAYDKLDQLTNSAKSEVWLDGYLYIGLEGVTNTFQYDAEGQLLEAQESSSILDSDSSVLTNSDYAYAYDPAGNRIKAEIQNGPEQNETFPGPITLSVTPANASLYTVNGLNQLTTRASSGDVPIRFSGSVDEPVSGVTVNGDAATMTADPNSSTGGELFNAWVNLSQGAHSVPVAATGNNTDVTTKNADVYVAGGAGPDKTFSYDLDGNCTGYTSSAGNVSYEWDAENRLTAVNFGGGYRSEFLYDGFGRRVQIVEKSSGTVTSTSRFVWSGTQMCEARDAENDVSKRFFWDGEEISGNPYYFTFDRLGSIQEMTDGDGNIRAQYTYDAYGNQTYVQGDMDADFGYAGYYLHGPTDLYLTLFRAYDSDTGRWLNRDPIGERGGINLYDYVLNDPINRIDPYGLDNIYNMAAGNNAVPNITLSGSVNGGPVTTQYNGGGLGDPLFLIGGMTMGGMLVGGAAEAVPEAGAVVCRNKLKIFIGYEIYHLLDENWHSDGVTEHPPETPEGQPAPDPNSFRARNPVPMPPTRGR